VSRLRDAARTLAVVASLLVLAPGAGAAGATEPPSNDMPDSLVGVWAGERRFGPEVEGDLVVARDGGRWSLEIAGFRLAAAEREGAVTWTIPGDGGELSLQVGSATGPLDGQWIQPGVVGMFGQRFSTPVHLAPTGPGRWRGEVSPLRDRVRLFLVVEPREGGGLRAWLRNPEVNFGRLFLVRDVVREGDRVRLLGTTVWQKEAANRTLFEGLWHEDTGTLSLFVESLGGTFDLRKLDPSTGDFLPRAWAGDAYRYAPPIAGDDGWPTADLASVGMAPRPMEELVAKIVSTPMAAVDSPYIEAVLVARHGRLVFEEYFHGHGRFRTHDVRSASKSLTTSLVGAAVHAGCASLGDRVYATMSGGAPPADLDPRAGRMTLEHLITMSSGLACDDWNDESPGNEDTMQSQSEEPDWYRYVLDLPMVHEPGETFGYCSAGMNLAGGMLARRCGASLTELFDRLLARPLEMGVYHTNLMPTGKAYAGGGLRLTARDFLKFGQLMLDDGEWNGRRIFDPGWARRALERRFDVPFHGRVEGYGYGWWRFDYEVAGRRLPAFYAGGNGGNYILGIPDLDLVVVFQAANYGQSVMHETKYDYVPQYILRSVAEGGTLGAPPPESPESSAPANAGH